LSRPVPAPLCSGCLNSTHSSVKIIETSLQLHWRDSN
jgi:hypothetical protein